jgi:hypothetical protein
MKCLLAYEELLQAKKVFSAAREDRDELDRRMTSAFSK